MELSKLLTYQADVCTQQTEKVFKKCDWIIKYPNEQGKMMVCLLICFIFIDFHRFGSIVPIFLFFFCYRTDPLFLILHFRGHVIICFILYVQHQAIGWQEDFILRGSNLKCKAKYIISTQKLERKLKFPVKHWNAHWRACRLGNSSHTMYELEKY